MMRPSTTLALCLCWSHLTLAFLQSHDGRGSTLAPPSSRLDTKCYSIFDTLTSMGGVAPSQPVLKGNKAMLKSLLGGTFLEKNLGSVTCCYKASRDGWSAINFHDKVDDKGSGLVLARTRTGVTFGGFNPNGWRGTDDYYLSNTAFLWHAPSNLMGGSKVVKSPILPGSNAAVYDYATGGPNFGSDDLVLGEPRAAVMGGFTGPDMEDASMNAGDLRQGRCSFSGAYKFASGWPVRGRFSLVEVEVYCNSGSAKKKSFW